jgi:hypothetical protein
MIRVQMRVDDVTKGQTVFLGKAHIQVRIVNRIANRSQRLPTASEQIRNPDGITMQYLAKNHS